ncbi:hypothetical protein [Herbaspirillum sp. meg3]|uniref:hypothetical protein n=1 Tax=Herbaspirillum sp. meg3 TaxID=2025949 RepID=UPI0012FD4994|nr:hypothetical protein [Herbaspirillum sp. meg3]
MIFPDRNFLFFNQVAVSEPVSQGVFMFSFPLMQSPDEVRRMFNAELRLYNTVITNAVDVAFRIADLNLSVLKQNAAGWSEKSAKIGLAEGNTMPQWLDANHLKKDFEHFATYGQQVSKLMLDLQGELVKVAQQRASQTLSANAATGANQQSTQSIVPASGASAVAFIQNMVEQASKGYTQWAGTALSAMDAVESDAAHADGAKNVALATKTRARK